MTPANDTASRVLLALADLLESERRASLRDVARSVHRSRSTARYHLQRLAVDGLVVLPGGRWFGVDLTPEGWAWVREHRGKGAQDRKESA